MFANKLFNITNEHRNRICDKDLTTWPRVTERLDLPRVDRLNHRCVSIDIYSIQYGASFTRKFPCLHTCTRICEVNALWNKQLLLKYLLYLHIWKQDRYRMTRWKLKVLTSLQKAPNTVYLASNKIHRC